MTQVKICGVTTPDILAVVAKSGARFVGFVFADASPRALHPEQARLLARQIPTGLRSVGLFVDPDDAMLDRVLSTVPLDMIQLHGTESVARVHAIQSRYRIPIIKAFALATPADVKAIDPYLPAIDWILCDAKSPPASSLAGGNGIPFDWTLLKGKTFTKPWMLSGGLTPANVGEALECLSPDAVDVSSGVEFQRGQKDAQKIKDFVANVTAAHA